MSVRGDWALGAVLVLLLAGINLQLVLDEETGSRTGDAATAPIPPLPAEDGDRGVDTLGREIDTLRTSIVRPLERLRRDLRDLAASSAAPLGRLEPQLSAIARSTSQMLAALRGLGATGRALERIADLGRALRATTSELRALRRGGLPALSSELDTLTDATRTLNRRVPGLTDQLAATGRSLTAVMATLQSTNAALDRVTRCLRRPVLCD